MQQLGEDVRDLGVELLETGDELAGIVIHHGMYVHFNLCDVGDGLLSRCLCG